MTHRATAEFWAMYRRLPESVQRVADANYALLKADPRHPSLHFKRIGSLWSVRVGIGYRALATPGDAGPVWIWIGSHAEYDRIIRGA